MSQTTEAVGWLGKGTTRNPRNRRHRLPKLVLRQVQVVDAESESATMEVAEGMGWLGLKVFRNVGDSYMVSSRASWALAPRKCWVLMLRAFET